MPEVSGAPHFTQPIHSAVAVEGTTAAFEVVVFGQKPLQVAWYKDGEPCANNPNYEFIVNENENRYAHNFIKNFITNQKSMGNIFKNCVRL